MTPSPMGFSQRPDTHVSHQSHDQRPCLETYGALFFPKDLLRDFVERPLMMDSVSIFGARWSTGALPSFFLRNGN